MRGWWNESYRHSLAARGIPTLNVNDSNYNIRKEMDRFKFKIVLSHDGEDIGWLEGDRRGNHEIENLDLYIKHDHRSRGFAHRQSSYDRRLCFDTRPGL